MAFSRQELIAFRNEAAQRANRIQRAIEDAKVKRGDAADLRFYRREIGWLEKRIGKKVNDGQ